MAFDDMGSWADLGEVREMRYEGLKVSLLVLVLIGSGLGSLAQAAEPGVTPFGVYPLLLPGLPTSPDAKPKVLLWCHGVKLVGVVVADEGRDKSAVAAQDRRAPTAFLLRDGRCEPNGSGVSFGFLLPLKAWVFGSPARTPPEERTAWLLHRFEGSVEAGLLKGVLVQVDVNHPGYSFRESRTEVGSLPEAQASFADESGWLGSVARTYSLAQREP
jgi:hypothetical protein